MRAARLARVAAQAESLRLRSQVRRTAFRAVYGAAATIFVLAALAVLHVAAVMALEAYVIPIYAVLIVAGIDVVIAVVLGLIAANSSPSRIEVEALEVRKQAQGQLMEMAALTALIGPALRFLGTRKTYGLALAALTARYLGGNR